MSDRTSVKILADSLSTGPLGFHRLTTLQCTYPKFINGEVNTHRALSRNSSSARAIPVEKIIKDVLDNPFVPEKFPVNRPGMSATEYIGSDDDRYYIAKRAWVEGMYSAVRTARQLVKSNVHKQITNRVLEPYMWHTAIISATEWENFFRLRCNPETTQPEFYKLATMMHAAMNNEDMMANMKVATIGDWHLPFMGVVAEDADLSRDQKIAVSIARCARVSYLTHDGVRDIDKDLKLYDTLKSNGHLSPAEHVATPTVERHRWANFQGWEQARYVSELIPNVAY